MRHMPALNVPVVAAPAPAPARPSTPAPPPAPSSKPVAPIPLAVIANYNMREIRRDPGGHVAKPVKCAICQGNTYIYTVALVSILTTRKSNLRGFCNRSPMKASPHISIAPVSGFQPPTNISEAEASPNADIWRHSINRELHSNKSRT